MLFHRFRRFFGLHTSHYIAAAINKKFREIPANVAAVSSTRLLLLQIIEKRAGIRSININFGEDRKGNSIINLTEFLSLFTRTAPDPQTGCRGILILQVLDRYTVRIASEGLHTVV